MTRELHSGRGGLRDSAGRPDKDEVYQLTVDIAAALQMIVETGPQEARDLVMAWLEGYEIEPVGEIGKDIFLVLLSALARPPQPGRCP